jgi:hypothetical protein
VLDLVGVPLRVAAEGAGFPRLQEKGMTLEIEARLDPQVIVGRLILAELATIPLATMKVGGLSAEPRGVEPSVVGHEIARLVLARAHRSGDEQERQKERDAQSNRCAHV